MVGVSLPGRLIRVIGLIAPIYPFLAFATGEEFKERTWAAGLDQIVLFIGFSRVFTLATAQIIYLCTAGLESPRILTPHSEQNQLRHVAEIETHAPAIGATIFADFVPDQIALVLKAPSLHDRYSVWK